MLTVAYHTKFPIFQGLYKQQSRYSIYYQELHGLDNHAGKLESHLEQDWVSFS